MAIKTRIDPDTGLRRHEVQGKFMLADIRQTLEAIYSRPGFRPDANVLWDLRDGTPDFSTDDVRQLAEFVAENWGPRGRSKAAFVVSSDYQFGMSRMYEMLLKSQSRNALMVFRDIDDAERWLADDKK